MSLINLYNFNNINKKYNNNKETKKILAKNKM